MIPRIEIYPGSFTPEHNQSEEVQLVWGESDTDTEKGSENTNRPPPVISIGKVVRGILIALLIIGLFAGGVFFVNNVDFSDILPDSTSDYGTLQVTSNPSGLEVALDGEYLGVTPLYRSDIKEGHYSISLIDGVAQPLEIVAGETTHVNLVGDSHSSGTSGGSMSITLKPDVRASVYVDGEYHGVTTNSEPLTVTGISAGNHVLLIRANGYADLEYPFTSDGKSKQNVVLQLSMW